MGQCHVHLLHQIATIRSAKSASIDRGTMRLIIFLLAVFQLLAASDRLTADEHVGKTTGGSLTAGHRFEYPTIQDSNSGNVYRLDWCYGWAQRCGQDAADAFCQANGYRRTYNFEKQSNVAPTWVIQAHRTCNEGHCDSFSFIDCE
jgi:hypothetical protein